MRSKVLQVMNNEQKQVPSRGGPWELEFPWAPFVTVIDGIKSECLNDPIKLIMLGMIKSIQHGISMFKEDVIIRILVADDEKTATFKFYRGFNMYNVWNKCGKAHEYSKWSRDPNVARFSCLLWKKVSEPDNKWNLYTFPCHHYTLAGIKTALAQNIE